MARGKISPGLRAVALLGMACLGFFGPDAVGAKRAAAENNTANSMSAVLRDLERRYGEFGCIITNPQTGEVLLSYNDPLISRRPLCPGSLLKPFGLLALARSASVDPKTEIVCKGKTRGEISCWLQEGHGRINLTQALAYSCNYYFYYFFKDRLQKDDYAWVLKSFGLPPLPGLRGMSKQDFYKAAVGLDSELMITPLQMIYAYNALFNGGKLFNPGGERTRRIYVPDDVRDILAGGMRECALYGTGKKIYKNNPGMDIIIKTGTGASVNMGTEVWYKKTRWVVVLSPGLDPVFSMLVVMEKKESEDIHELTIELLRQLTTR
jgi:cell division protein FtsI/penicillin-binding protein 2